MGILLNLLWLGTIGLKGWALVDCATRPTDAFPLHNKLTKPAWVAILGVSLAAGVLFGLLGLLSIAGTVATIVYLVDVRPAVGGRSF